jgi:hypothetical protein
MTHEEEVAFCKAQDAKMAKLVAVELEEQAQNRLQLRYLDRNRAERHAAQKAANRLMVIERAKWKLPLLPKMPPMPKLDRIDWEPSHEEWLDSEFRKIEANKSYLQLEIIRAKGACVSADIKLSKLDKEDADWEKWRGQVLEAIVCVRIVGMSVAICAMLPVISATLGLAMVLGRYTEIRTLLVKSWEDAIVPESWIVKK